MPSGCRLLFIENDKCCKHSRNPAQASEYCHKHYRPATTVEDCKRRENDAQNNSKARHKNNTFLRLVIMVTATDDYGMTNEQSH